MPVLSTGWMSPSTNGTPATYDGSATEFTNPANAYSSNDSYATTVDNDVPYKWQSYGGFGINLDSSYVIVGIEVALEGKTSTGSTGVGVYIEDANSNFAGFSGSYGFTTTESTITYGGPTELPGGTWTATGLLDANFHALVYTGSVNDGKTIYLDHIKVNVYYDTGPNTSDTITITENVSLHRYDSTEKYDIVTVSEDITVLMSTLAIDVSEFPVVFDLVYDANDGITYDTGEVYDDIYVVEDIQKQSTRYGPGGKPKARTERHGL